ncbi:hypothetical protein JW977_00595 [Candidatus Falkowbacteria bacterium]|nr:hypothetical protein [Candidatus Falkowbacteria bacterium]
MKNKNLLVILIIVVVVIVAFVVYFSINSVSKIENANVNEPMLIGGQKDAHGCLIAAGYSWCEPKQKCLRMWEEDCYGQDLIDLTAVFAKEHNQIPENVFITIMKNNENYFSGTIRIGAQEVEGGGFLVRKLENNWQIDYEGNGSIDCVKIKGLGYPEEVLEGYCD